MRDLDNEKYVCSCPSFTYRQIDCKHIKFLKELTEEEKIKFIYADC